MQPRSLSTARAAIASVVVLAGCSGPSSFRSDGSDGSGAGTEGRVASGSGGGSSDNGGQGGSVATSASGGNVTSGAGRAAGSAGTGNPGRAGAGLGGGATAGAGGGTGGGLGARGGQGMGAFGGSEPSVMGGSAGVPSAAGTSSSDPTGEDPPSELPPATWDTLKLVLTGTTPPCTSSTCHGTAGGKGGFGFPVKNDAQLYTQLTTHVVKDCGSIPIVTPGDPQKSALLMLLRGPCSDEVERMPRGCTDADGNCVPPEYIAALEQWITEGAAHP